MSLPRALGVLLLLTASLPACDRDRATPTVTRATAAAPGDSVAGTAAPAPASARAVAARPPHAHAPAPQVAAHRKALGALVAAFNAHDPKAIAALYDPGAVVVGPSPGGFTPEIGREPLVVGHEALFASQPDVRSATTRLIMVGDNAVQEWVTMGTAAASGKAIGFRAASVYRFGADGLVKRDSTYFDLLTPAVQTGNKRGEARPIPPLPSADPIFVFADETAQEPQAVRVLRSLHAALRAGKLDQVGPLLADDVVETSHLRVDDATGRDAVVKELGDVVAQLPGLTVGTVLGDDAVAAAEVVFSAPERDGGGPQAKIHALQVVDVAGGRIKRSALYASRRELEDE
jgi:ketosteroid isomerase-like protein